MVAQAWEVMQRLMAAGRLYRELGNAPAGNGGGRMKRKFSYSIGEMNRRLLAIGKSIRGYLVISTLSSIIGALAHMGLMGFGALWLLAAAGFCGNFACMEY